MTAEFQTGIIKIHTHTWIQTLHTARGTHIQSFGFIEPDKNFTMAGGTKMYEIGCALTLQNEKHNAGSGALIKEGRGIFEFRKGATIKETDTLQGWVNVADELYSDLWTKLCNSDHLSAAVTLHLGPVESLDGNVLWDRAKQKTLLITEVGITLTTKLEHGAERYRSARMS